MTTEVPLILVGDHRGAGLQQGLAALGLDDYRFETTSGLRRTLERLAGAHPALVLLDPLAPGSPTELEAVDRARAACPRPVPVLVVAAPSGPLPELPRWRSESGPWDVIARDAPADEWRLRFKRLAELCRLLEESRVLRHRASHDDRTDLLRPAAFQARLVEHFSAAQRHGLDLALVLIDLDAFGAVNKQYDHTVGDGLIARVGEVIRDALRTEDVAGRLGGDEFAVLLPYTRKVDASAVVNRLCAEIRTLSTRPSGASMDLRVSASIGFETFDGADLDSVETLRLHAERALRESKASGGDRGTYFRSLARPEVIVPAAPEGGAGAGSDAEAPEAGKRIGEA